MASVQEHFAALRADIAQQQNMGDLTDHEAALQLAFFAILEQVVTDIHSIAESTAHFPAGD